MPTPMLELKDAHVHYAGVRALDGVSLAVGEREIVALMGPNGAGKSTALKSLFGLATLSRGSVFFEGHPFVPLPYEMNSRGISYVPQGRQVFKNLTVRENLELGGYALGSTRRAQEAISSALELFPALRTKLSEKAGTLSGGQQQMLTIGRGLICDPRVLLLDEPSLGLAPKVVKEVFQTVRRIHAERGIGVVVVEHSIKSVLEIADRAYVLAQGKVVAEGPARQIGESDVLERIFFAAA